MITQNSSRIKYLLERSNFLSHKDDVGDGKTSTDGPWATRMGFQIFETQVQNASLDRYKCGASRKLQHCNYIPRVLLIKNSAH